MSTRSIGMVEVPPDWVALMTTPVKNELFSTRHSAGTDCGVTAKPRTSPEPAPNPELAVWFHGSMSQMNWACTPPVEITKTDATAVTMS